MNGGCRVDVFNEAGFLYATRDAGPHDWRLFSRAEQLEYEFTDYERAYENALIRAQAGRRRGIALAVVLWRSERCPALTEKELLSNVIETARIYGWFVAHFRSVPVKRGKRVVWETPVQADGKGFPDLCMVRERILFCELKVGKNKPSQEQLDWLDLLHAAGVEAYLWRESDWLDGTIPEVLKHAA
jgi:hypothetical protein